MTSTPISHYCTESKHAVLIQLIQENDAQTLKSLSKAQQSFLKACQFTGKVGQLAIMPDAKGNIEIVFIGAGQAQWTQALAKAATHLPQGTYHTTHPLSHQAKLYWGMAQYQFDRYKKQAQSNRALLVTLEEKKALDAELTAIRRARDLINTPTNDMGPQALEAVVRTIGKTHKANVDQWRGEELLDHNYPAIHAVGRAAAQAPRLIQLTWGNKKHPKIALVGKGVCFDSGGLDLKPSNAMRLMKKDMGGAAQAIALAEWIMVQALPIHLSVYIAAVENSIGPNSYRPGDVLTMRNGLTVEIDNTDAEGRLVLADALVKASEAKPEVIFDFATLTGAARVAVGTDIAAMFSNDDALAQSLLEEGQTQRDPLWRLPLHQEYRSMLDSTIADILNSAPTSYAGAITAALFLERFIEPNGSWVHFDVMAWNKTSAPGKPVGGEAMAIRAVYHWLRKKYD